MPKKKNEESIQSETTHFSKKPPHKRIQTAEGWKRSQIKVHKSSSKSAGKS